ncbi:MAG: response regulator [Nitrospiraceae bacterium]|nr:response regulator [Nitrospiraceae bacterium]
MQVKKKILVVDDDEMLLDVAKELLADERYEIITHHEGIGVMNLVYQLQPDLVLLDINMPVLSGDALARLLRANAGTDNIRIVFYSSNDEESLRESVSTCGVHGYICKGDIANLHHQVDRFLGMPCC